MHLEYMQPNAFGVRRTKRAMSKELYSCVRPTATYNGKRAQDVNRVVQLQETYRVKRVVQLSETYRVNRVVPL